MISNKIKVFARIKPPRDQMKSYMYEVKSNNVDDNTWRKCLTLYPFSQMNYKRSRQKLGAEHFIFENIFIETVSQEIVYNSMAKAVVERAIEGYNGTVMAYGQKQNKKYKVFLSIVEIYNDQAFDLLSKKCPKYGLTRVNSKQIIMRNLEMIHVSNMREVDKQLRKASRNRKIGETPMNDVSSRSHCIFSLHLQQSPPNNPSAVIKSKVHMIDLSGSEKYGKKRLGSLMNDETKHINLSLHYIELVIRALSDKSREHIPYRNSVLTAFLRDSLGGNCNTVMIFTLSLEPMYFEETILTCRFSQRVSLVSNKIQKQLAERHSREMTIRKKQVQNNKNEQKPKPKVAVWQEKESSENNDEDIVVINEQKEDKENEMKETTSAVLDIKADERSETATTSSSVDFKELLDKEERNVIIEVDNLKKLLREFTDIANSFEIFSSKNTKTKSKYFVYDQLGLYLPKKNPQTGKKYKPSEHENFYTFLIRRVNIKDFKSEYYDRYCDLVTKQLEISTILNTKIRAREKLKNKYKFWTIHGNKNSLKLKILLRDIKITKHVIKGIENILKEIQKEKSEVQSKVLEVKNQLINQFNNEWKDVIVKSTITTINTVKQQENVLFGCTNNKSDIYTSGYSTNSSQMLISNKSQSNIRPQLTTRMVNKSSQTPSTATADAEYRHNCKKKLQSKSNKGVSKSDSVINKLSKAASETVQSYTSEDSVSTTQLWGKQGFL